MFEFIRDYKGEVPGASPKDCGNYLDMNLGMANYLAKRYLDNVLYGIDDSRLVYPEWLQLFKKEQETHMKKIGIIGAMELEVETLKAILNGEEIEDDINEADIL